MNKNALIENLISKGLGIDYYTEIMETVKQVDVSSNEIFQKTFNRFYRVRRNEQWRKSYYNLFEKSKGKPNLGFEEILTGLFQETGQIEASFSSKMLATINPHMPIWDQYVLKYLDLDLKGKAKDERLLNAIKIYGQVVAWYEKFLVTDEAKEYIVIFDSIVPHYQWMSGTKKIDFLIWSTGR